MSDDAVRCAVASVGELRTILSNVPDDHYVVTNQVGNLSLLDAAHQYYGYIDLTAVATWKKNPVCQTAWLHVLGTE